MKYLLYFCTFVFFIKNLQASPTGAPSLACESLIPQHNGTLPQNGSSPYQIDVGPPIIPGGRSYYVTISGISPSTTLKGFILQARFSNDTSLYRTVGSFDLIAPTETSAQVVNCLNNNDTATHTDRNPKSQIQVKWTAPSSGNGTVVFR